VTHKGITSMIGWSLFSPLDPV